MWERRAKFNSTTAQLVTIMQLGLLLVMNRTMSASTVLYIAMMIAIIVGVDLLFLRNKPLERLIVNVGIVVLFAAVYLQFVKKG